MVFPAVHVAYLFEAGVVPGIMVGLALALVILSCQESGLGDSRLARLEACMGKLNQPLFQLWRLLTFVSIAAGVATATESASLIIMVVTLVGIFIYKD
ncbi:MAG: hypothetical protein ACLUOI_39385 [Eisenbergiella sp.]